MAAHPVGADEHERAHGVAGRLLHIGLRDAGALGLGLGLDLLADGLLDLGPVAVERRDEFAVGVNGPVRLLPGRAAGALLDRLLVVLERAEERLPLGIDEEGSCW
jgi:hypothetical protein